MATAAALVLYEYPSAKRIALAIGVCVSNPGGMRDAAGQWQSPSTGEGEIDFDGIRQRVLDVKERISGGDLWTGEAKNLASDSVDGLLEQVDTAKRHFSGMGGSMECCSTIYHYAAEAFMAVATVMAGVAAWRLKTMLIPVIGVQIAVRGVIHGILAALGEVVSGLATKLGKTLTMTVGVVGMVNLMCATMTQMLTQKRPKPDFALAGVEYAPPEQEGGVGGLKPTNGGTPDTQAMAQGGGMMGGII
ncbi:hypothetical protein E1267_30125 [Nonomuraea longispora]|uniref:WXG100 family type VII secretion target n=1 Tax=Nonomuraea longispora TaxID=1848320 RepID=A0A4V2XJC5_9ACTN|nr:hypothetical protein [Nonomuraea longispora]TDC02136.1 hypothetical protein E1267_30125 [Nonomuraea longispora]